MSGRTAKAMRRAMQKVMRKEIQPSIKAMIKPKPSWCPKFLYRWAVNLVLDI